jgi:protein-S-isoprenylcysteine O-methyltransferase Ste14
VKRRLKITGFIVFVALLVISVFPSAFFRHGLAGSFDEAAEIFGIALILLGQIFRASARGYKSEHSASGNRLIQTGPYAIVRNPMYLGILLIGSGIVLMLFWWWAILIFLSVFALRYLLLIVREEKKLTAAFPQEYAEYQKRTPRLLPSFSRLLRKDVSEYLPLKPGWLKREIGSIVAVLLITILIESWEDVHNEGLRAYFRESIGILLTVGLFIGLVVYLSRRTEGKDVPDKSKAAV